jgi:FtsH-binding integral membrane protein
MGTSGYGYAEGLGAPRTLSVFGRVMWLVAITLGFSALGAYLMREAGGGSWFITWLIALGCLVGLNAANARGHTQLALVLLFAVGLLLGASVGTTLNYYARTDPTALRQAFGATALFVGALGAGGYAIRRDLSFLYRFLFWLLVGLIVAGIVLILTNMQGAYTAYAIIGLVIFGLYTVVDFNRLRRAGQQEAIPLAAGIFLDVFNIFLFFLTLFGGGRR